MNLSGGPPGTNNGVTLAPSARGCGDVRLAYLRRPPVRSNVTFMGLVYICRLNIEQRAAAGEPDLKYSNTAGVRRWRALLATDIGDRRTRPLLHRSALVVYFNGGTRELVTTQTPILLQAGALCGVLLAIAARERSLTGQHVLHVVARLPFWHQLPVVGENVGGNNPAVLQASIKAARDWGLPIPSWRPPRSNVPLVPRLGHDRRLPGRHR